MKIFPTVIFIAFTISLLTACSSSKNAAQTAIAQTQVAEETANAFHQHETQLAVAQLQLTQNAVSLAQQQTQSALVQTQAALSLQMTLANATSSPTATEPLSVAANGTPDLTAESAQVPQGVNPISSMGVDFRGARIYSQGTYATKQHGYMITIQLADSVKEIKGKFFAEIATKKLTCSVYKPYPNRLYCVGLWPRGGYHAVRLYEDLSGIAQLVFVSEITVPEWTPTHKPLPTRTPYSFQ